MVGLLDFTSGGTLSIRAKRGLNRTRFPHLGTGFINIFCVLILIRSSSEVTAQSHATTRDGVFGLRAINWHTIFIPQYSLDFSVKKGQISYRYTC